MSYEKDRDEVLAHLHTVLVMVILVLLMVILVLLPDRSADLPEQQFVGPQRGIEFVFSARHDEFGIGRMNELHDRGYRVKAGGGVPWGPLFVMELRDD
jgi:hypothetical protein